MEYSYRIAKILDKLQDALDYKQYQEVLKDIQSVSNFEDLSENSQKIIKELES